jgi:uncharacterized membrane protein YfcA
METKTAAVHSVLIILFSQSSKLIAVSLDTGFSQYNLTALYYMIPGGIAGGLIGSSLNKRLNSEFIQVLFKIVVITIIGLNVFNMIKALVSSPGF